MSARLEHANLAVRDLDGTTRFLQTAFPDFVVRGGGAGPDGRHWRHVGDDETYVALEEASADGGRALYGPTTGLNHLGFVVDDARATRARLLAAGYTESTIPNEHPHRVRVYFVDADGFDWEFVEYRSAVAAERNDYDG